MYRVITDEVYTLKMYFEQTNSPADIVLVSVETNSNSLSLTLLMPIQEIYELVPCFL